MIRSRGSMTIANILPRMAITSLGGRVPYKNLLGLRRSQYPETDFGQLAFTLDLPIEAARVDTPIAADGKLTTMGDFVEARRRARTRVYRQAAVQREAENAYRAGLIDYRELTRRRDAALLVA
jgi:hypothetical protein